MSARIITRIKGTSGCERAVVIHSRHGHPDTPVVLTILRGTTRGHHTKVAALRTFERRAVVTVGLQRGDATGSVKIGICLPIRSESTPSPTTMCPCGGEATHQIGSARRKRRTHPCHGRTVSRYDAGLVDHETVAEQQAFAHVHTIVARHDIAPASDRMQGDIERIFVVRPVAPPGKGFSGILVKFQSVIQPASGTVIKAQRMAQAVAQILTVGVFFQFVGAVATVTSPAIKRHAEHTVHLPTALREEFAHRRPRRSRSGTANKDREPLARTVVQSPYELEVAHTPEGSVAFAESEK